MPIEANTVLSDEQATEACKAAIRKLQDAAWNCGTDEFKEGVSDAACNRRYDRMVAARSECVSAVNALCATVKALRDELAEEKRLRSELKQIAQAEIAEVSSVGAALKDNAIIDLRSRAIELCKAKAVEWSKQADEALARGIQTVADGKASRALAAKELAADLEALK